MANEFRIKNGLIVQSGTVTLSTFTLPASLGNNGDVLRIPTGGGTTLEWASFTEVSSSGVTAVNNFAENRLTTVGSTTSELDGEANLTFDGSAFQVTGTLTVGVDDTGHDVKFFGATSGSYMLWDESQDDLVLGGAARLGIGTTSPQSNLHISSGTSGDAVLILEADTDNNDETDQPFIVFEQDGGTQHSAIGSHSGSSTDNNALIFSNSVSSSGVEAGMIFKTGETSGYANATERMRITPAGTVTVAGAFTAATKSFVIEHPTKEGMTLEHGSLEGPEHGVYVRGKLERDNVIELPDYWTGLVDADSVSVQLTPNKTFQQLYVEKIEDNKVYVKNMTDLPINCFFFIQAERKDVEKMVVEY